MHLKTCFLILALGATACGLLVVRQQRIQTVHELASVSRRIDELERTRWDLRIAIARATTPQRVETLAARFEPQPTALAHLSRPNPSEAGLGASHPGVRSVAMQPEDQ